MQPGGAGPSSASAASYVTFCIRTARCALHMHGTARASTRAAAGRIAQTSVFNARLPRALEPAVEASWGPPTRDGLTRPAHAESLEATGQVGRAARGGALGTSSRDRTDQDVRLRPRLCNSASRRRSSTGQSPHNSQRTLGLTQRCLLHDASFALKTSDDDRTGLERPRSWRNRAAWPGHGPYHLMGLHIANGDAGRSAVGRLSSFQP